MDSPEFVTTDLDLHTFQTGIFFTEANTLSPVVPQAKPAEYQTLEYTCRETGKIIKEAVGQWATYAAVAGIAQYSLKKNKPVNLLGRANTYFRWATKDEAARDCDHFGDQVIGPSLKEASEELKKRPTINLFGEPHVYTGPERLERIVVASRVFPGRVPADISAVAREVDEASGKNELMVSQGYHFFRAEKGKLTYQAFMDVKEFDPKKMTLHGELELKDNKMTWYPNGDKTMPKDFSDAIYRR